MNLKEKLMRIIALDRKNGPTYTPGPWGIDDLKSDRRHFFGEPRYVIYSPSKNKPNNIVANVIGERNARLIAAAPEMYKLLERAAGYISALAKAHGNAGGGICCS